MRKNNMNVFSNAYNDFSFSNIDKRENIIIYKIENETGNGKMYCYNVFPGIQLTYNNLNMETAYQEIIPKEGILQIDHCLDGCYEFELLNKEHALIGKGDISILDFGKATFINSCLPTKHYQGLTIFIDINIAQNYINKNFSWIDIDLKAIQSKIAVQNASLIIRTRKEVEHIIRELYDVKGEIQHSYFILKILEILLVLNLIDDKDTIKLPSFSEIVYTATRECYQEIVDNPFEKHSIFDLSSKHAISESSLKRCFSAMTGTSIGVFIKNKCLEASADLLIRQSDLSIGDIAEIAGYLNPGKYTAAFKAHFGKTPMEFRKEQLT